MDWETIWKHPENASLRSIRKPDVLYPGDPLFIPEKSAREEQGATEKRHRFRRKGVPAKLHLQLMKDGQPRANETYSLNVDGKITTGTTDAEGKLEIRIPPNAKEAKLLLGEKQEEFTLDLGHLDPVSEVSGVQARLNNLGFYCGEVDGKLGPRTKAALKSFQKEHGLPETGEADAATRAELEEAHGS
jgi:N-acetylmuramoyl-L-alanine amidase